MLILTLKTDQPQAEVALYQDDKLLAEEKWQAHRQLAETIHLKMSDLLKSQKQDWTDIKGIVCYKGPGSFTGLRIGLSLGNATAYGVNVPIVSTTGNDWQAAGIKRLLEGDNETGAMPKYGGEIHVTKPRK